MVFVRSALSVHFFPRMTFLYFFCYHGKHQLFVNVFYVAKGMFSSLLSFFSLFLFCPLRLLRRGIDSSVFLDDGEMNGFGVG
jgi:hypothetical protein